MDRENILSQYDKMRNEIKDSKDQHLEKLFKCIRSHFRRPREQRNKELFLAELEDTIYDSLTETYAITAKAVEEIYDIIFTEKIDDDTLRNLTYSADGKTLNDRLSEHYDDAIDRNDPTTYFYNRIVVIMDTEALYASNHVIHGKLKRRATYVEVINGDNEACWEHPECEYWLQQGKIPIEELKELPPYHPECECEVIYYIDDK